MDVLKRPADEFGNDDTVEHLWAEQAFEHARVYFNIVCSVDPRFLRLTPYDDLIYSTFRQDFPTYNVARLADDELKSDDAKIRWRTFCDKFNKLEDFSFGTIIRTDASGSFHPENTTLVIRLQFWALEIARNREGHNDGLRQNFRDAQVTEAEQQHPDAVAQQSLST